MNIEQVKKILNDPGNWIKRRTISGLNRHDDYYLDVDKAAKEICQTCKGTGLINEDTGQPPTQVGMVEREIKLEIRE